MRTSFFLLLLQAFLSSISLFKFSFTYFFFFFAFFFFFFFFSSSSSTFWLYCFLFYEEDWLKETRSSSSFFLSLAIFLAFPADLRGIFFFSSIPLVVCLLQVFIYLFFFFSGGGFCFSVFPCFFFKSRRKENVEIYLLIAILSTS